MVRIHSPRPLILLPERSRGTAVLRDRKLRRVQDLIESRLNAGLTLQQLATEVSYSRAIVCGRFVQRRT